MSRRRIPPEGENIHKALKIVNRKPGRVAPVQKFTGYTTTLDERLPYFDAKYDGGQNTSWSICAILKLAPNYELPFRLLYEVYYNIYDSILDDRTLRKIFRAEDTYEARNCFAKEVELFNVRRDTKDFYIQLKNPEAEYVPQEILEKEKQSCLRRRVQPF